MEWNNTNRLWVAGFAGLVVLMIGKSIVYRNDGSVRTPEVKTPKIELPFGKK